MHTRHVHISFVMVVKGENCLYLLFFLCLLVSNKKYTQPHIFLGFSHDIDVANMSCQLS